MGKPTVYLRSTNVPFEQLGSGTLSGVWPENVQTQFGPNGLEQATFDLHRDPGTEWPDLLPFTPVVIFDEGLVAGTGRIQETPTQHGGSDDKISVVIEGWVAHLADDALQLRMVMNDLSAWKDARSVGTAGGAGVSLAVWTPSFNVVVGDGLITIDCRNGAALNTVGGVILDAGPGRVWATSGFNWVGGGAANLAFVVAAGDTLGALTDVSILDPAPIVTTIAGNVFTPTAPGRRYLYAYAQATGVVAASDTAWLQLSQAEAFSEAGFSSGGVPILKFSDIAARVLPYAPLLNQSTADITTTAFNFPHFDGPWATPREYLESGNAYHGYQIKVQDDPAGGQPRLRIRPVPTIAQVLARVGAGVEFNDASRNDGGDIYNRCVVHYTDAAGNDAYINRTTAAALAASASFDIASSVSVGPNPGFETAGGPPPNGWSTTIGGTFTRDTGVFDSGVASGRANTDGAGNWGVTTTITGLTPGRTYQIKYRVRANAIAFSVQATMRNPSTNEAIGSSPLDSFTNAIGVAFTTRTFTFTAPVSSALLDFSGVGTASSLILYLDGFQLWEAYPTIPDRQGFVRTYILETGSRLTSAAATQFADVFLLAHQISPLRGTLSITGPALQDIVSGQPIPVGLLGRYVGDAVTITEGDPDTAAQGRVGIIASADIDHANNTATIAIDSRKDFLDVLKSRFTLFQGGGG